SAEISTQRFASNESAATPITQVPRDNGQPIPLSFAQQRLWLLEQLEGKLVAYNMPYAIRLDGPLDAESLRKAFEIILHRHEPLRTTFRVQGGEPRQVILPRARFELKLIDLGDLPSNQREAASCVLRRDEAERPFNLTTDSTLRASLVRLAREQHILL